MENNKPLRVPIASGRGNLTQSGRFSEISLHYKGTGLHFIRNGNSGFSIETNPLFCLPITLCHTIIF
jgi:hypothetical protein